MKTGQKELVTTIIIIAYTGSYSIPGRRSSKSFNILNAVQGLALTVAAASTGKPGGIFKT